MTGTLQLHTQGRHSTNYDSIEVQISMPYHSTASYSGEALNKL